MTARLCTALLTVACLLALPLPAAAQATADNAPYVTGGVGEEELAVLKLVRGDFNLHLLFADKAGTYLSGVDIDIIDTSGTTRLALRDAGPFLFVRLPAGSYRLEARYEGKPQQQRLDLRASGGRDVVFRW